MAVSWMILTFWNVQRHVLSSSAVKWNASDQIKVGRGRSTKWILRVASHPLSNTFLPFCTLFLLSFSTHLKSADFEIYLLLEIQYSIFFTSMIFCDHMLLLPLFCFILDIFVLSCSTVKPWYPLWCVHTKWL